MNRKILLWIFTVSFLINTNTKLSTSYAENKKLRVGIIIPLTGDFSAYGESVRNGMELAISENTDDTIQLYFEDDMGHPKESLKAFHKLVYLDKVNVVVTISAQPSLAVAPMAEAAKIPLISIAIPPKIVEGREYVFLYFATSERMASAMVDEASRRNIQSIARLSTIHDGRAEMKKQFDRYNEKKIKILFDEEVLPSERDFRTLIARISRMPDVQAIYTNLVLGQIGVFARQTKEMGLNIPLFTSEFFGDPNEIKVAEGALSDQWYVDQREPSAQFLGKLRKHFGESTPIFAAANGYDIILLLRSYISQHIPTGQELVSLLKDVKNFSGSLGTYSMLSDHRMNIPVDIKAIQSNTVTVKRRIEQ